MDTKVSGQWINIDGAELYYEYLGEQNDGPTIVFMSGYGWPLENWQPIREDVSTFAKIFMYDRESVGNSSQGNNSKHSLQIVEHLRTLLQKANIKPPFILVGHSFGGVNARLYTNMYPKEIAGVILLESCHEDQNKVMAPLISKEAQEGYFAQFHVEGIEGDLTEFEESLEQVRGADIGNTPLMVMTGRTQPIHTTDSMAVWMNFQKELATLSTKSKHIIIKEAGHAIHIDKPEAVIEAIREMVEMVSK